jgi:competence ComEA-like helix-hairpin-helix protein
MLFGTLGFGLVLPAPPQSLPEGKGRAEVQRICGTCHGMEGIIKARLSADQWNAVVDEMASRGAQATDDEFDRIVSYLAANFGKSREGEPPSAAAPSKVDLNRANARELTESLGITQSDAEAIVEYRVRNGTLKSWSDVQKIPGIDQKKLESRKDRITFTAPPSSDRK